MSALPQVQYQWLLDYDPESPTIFAKGGELRAVLMSELLFGAVLALPPVVRMTGVPGVAALSIVAAHSSAVVLQSLLQPWARRSASGFHVIALFDVLAGLSACLGLILASGGPVTLLWSLFFLYAGMNGGVIESPPSRVVLLLHVGVPLLALLAFTGHPSHAWAIGAPLISAGFSAGAFHFMAGRAGASRRLGKERDAALSLLREKDAELSRLRLARDLHDSVGASLGLLAVQADRIQEAAENPMRIRQIAQAMRGLARDGLGDLRGVVETLAPEDNSVGALCAGLEIVVKRLAGTASIELAVDGPKGAVIAAQTRLALMRVFQEAIRNAVVHGSARRVQVRLSGGGQTKITIEDDGTGFDPQNVIEGRGLASMRTRAAELGAVFEIRSVPGHGSTISLFLGQASA